jgi:hypothetical protein
MRTVKSIIFMVCLLSLMYAGQSFADNQTAMSITPDLVVPKTPEALERGEYLANNVLLCLDCHSTRDYTRYSGPIIPGTLGQGGEDFSAPYGTLYARNITPYGLKDWTDFDIYRALTVGMTNDNEQLFLVMPYWKLAGASQEDVLAIIAYIRTLAPVVNDPPERALTIPDSAFAAPPGIGTNMPRTGPDPSDWPAYTAYMGNLSVCVLCHTPADLGGMLEMPKSFSGGYTWVMPSGHSVTSVNITPDKATGIGLWPKERFVDYLTCFRDRSTIFPTGDGLNTIMPVYPLSGMTRQDLEAIYDFLMTQPAVSNDVDGFVGE